MVRFLLCCLTALLPSLSVLAQNLNHQTYELTRSVPPVYPSLQTNSTFDVRVNLAQEMAMNMPSDMARSLRSIITSPIGFQFGKFTQVDSTGDFHAIVLVQGLSFEQNYAGEQVANVFLHTTIYDKLGTQFHTRQYNLRGIPPFVGTAPFSNPGKNRDAYRDRIIQFVQSAVNYSLTDFANTIYGYEGRLPIRFAWLSNVKKGSDLMPFKEEADQLMPLLRKNPTIGNFLEMTTQEVPFWEKMKDYAGEGNVQNVKRAALHNLSLYYTLKGESDKATEYLTAYKTNSATEAGLLSNLMTTLSGDGTGVLPAPNGQKILTLREMQAAHAAYAINGTITLDGRNDGTYTGIIRIKRPEPKAPEAQPQRSSGMFDIGKLSADGLSITVETTDKKGKPTTINTGGGSVKTLKGDDGTEYVFRKYGSALLMGSALYLLRADYQSPKVTVYTSLIPDASEYVIMKTGDDKGVKSTLLNARKNVLDYLKECPMLETKYGMGSANAFNIKAIAQDYTNCK